MTETRTMTENRTIVHHAAISTSHALAMARADIHEAVNAGPGARRRQYALSARDNAAETLLDPDSTTLERDYASYYFVDAEAMIAIEAAQMPARYYL